MKKKQSEKHPPPKKPQANQELLTMTAHLAQSAVYFVSLIRCHWTWKEKQPTDLTHWKVGRGSPEKKVNELNS